MRKLEAKIVLEYDDEETAEAIAKAVSPDNFKTPTGLSIETVKEKNKVITRIKCRRKLPTFIATIDDLLFCTSTAEKTIQITKKL
ncbi:MAG: KEOPS complex subunit Pcc1 [Candidatus Bathyarchaeia archaeon]|nr:KEOPS complex subunit Pcc1 [Candidatus Bathyarchaeia archaeon]